MKTICSGKAVDRKTAEEQLDMLGVKETADGLATENGVGLHRHVLRRDDDCALRVALDLKVSGMKK